MLRFAPDRAPREGGYTAYVANGVTAVELTANASHSGATVAVMRGEGDDASPANAGGGGTYSVTLGTAGTDTVIMVTVTAADDVAKATYRVTVMRGGIGSEVTLLSALSLMAGGNKVMLDPEFASGTDEYTASVAHATSRVEVMATTTGRGATAAVTSDKDSNVQNNVVDLSGGGNVITVTVTAADKATMDTYTVTVTRVPSNLSADTTLNELSLALDDDTAIELMPDFVPNSASAEGGYTAEAGDATIPVTVTAIAAHTGASVAVMVMGDDDNSQVADTGAVTLNSAGHVTVILVTVTAADLATTATYRITVSTPAACISTRL